MLSAVGCQYLLSGFERRSTTLILRAAALLLLAFLSLLWLRLQNLIHRGRCDLQDSKYWQVCNLDCDYCVTMCMLICSHAPLDHLCVDVDMYMGIKCMTAMHVTRCYDTCSAATADAL